MVSHNYIEYVTGDILGDQETSGALVNPVNCVGICGKGLAEKFKNIYPENYETYRNKCLGHDMQIGRVFLTHSYPHKSVSMFEAYKHRNDPIVPVANARRRWIVNFPTKKHWRDPSQLEWIEMGLKDLVREITDRGISTIAIPALGCGNGGLPWNYVRVLIEQYLSQVSYIRVRVYEPE